MVIGKNFKRSRKKNNNQQQKNYHFSSENDQNLNEQSYELLDQQYANRFADQRLKKRKRQFSLPDYINKKSINSEKAKLNMIKQFEGDIFQNIFKMLKRNSTKKEKMFKEEEKLKKSQSETID